MLADAEEFASEGAGLGGGRLGLRRVALAALGGGEDVGAGLLVERLEVQDVALEFAGVGADEGVAFPHLVERSVRRLLVVGGREWNGY